MDFMCIMYLFIYLFIYSIIHVCSKCIKQKYSILSIYNYHHKHSVTRLHESEKEINNCNSVYIITIIKI